MKFGERRAQRNDRTTQDKLDGLGSRTNQFPCRKSITQFFLEECRGKVRVLDDSCGWDLEEAATGGWKIGAAASQ